MLAGRGPGLRPGRAAARAAQALLGRVVPGRLAGAVATAARVKLAIAALPLVLAGLLLLVVIMGVVGAVAGGVSEASGCGGASPFGASGAVASRSKPLHGPPAFLIPIYYDAAAQNGLDPDGAAILAGINRVETNFGTDLRRSGAGAIGWMQFMPATWADPRYGGNGDPNNPHDAIFAAARYLRANGAPGDWYHAIFAYNHADWYVREVLGYARRYGGVSIAASAGPDIPAPDEPPLDGSPKVQLFAAPNPAGCTPAPGVAGAKATLLPDGRAAAPAGAPPAVQRMIAAGNQIAPLPYVWGGHHALGSPTNGYDCSSAVSYVLFAAGLLGAGQSGFTSGQFWTGLLAADFVAGGPVPNMQPGPGQWVTIYVESNGAHVFMDIAGVRFDDSSDDLRNGKGPNGTNVSMWQPTFPKPPQGFVPSHPAGL